MKKWFLVLIICTSFTCLVDANGVLILTGVYSGENLYVQNPLLPDNHFSTEEVFVNEILVLSNPMTSAFTIDLSHLKVDQSVEVKILHKERYQPKIINAFVLLNHEINTGISYAPIANIFRWTNADQTTVRWLTHGEKGGGTFVIQRAHKEKWVAIDEIPAKSVEDNSVYKVLMRHQNGENTYRVKLTDRDGFVSYSDQFSYRSK